MRETPNRSASDRARDVGWALHQRSLYIALKGLGAEREEVEAIGILERLASEIGMRRW